MPQYQLPNFFKFQHTIINNNPLIIFLFHSIKSITSKVSPKHPPDESDIYRKLYALKDIPTREKLYAMVHLTDEVMGIG